ncbi:hypothetical protein DJ013_20115 [Arcticibacterium luteifluviistationis]|uniref:Uncharacterized protein n=2 Tax=Arcticibacterium luteifluviistationis TaxID=1784714 RepID=A0A2Z4GG26_9BACT|nr:hypothetical protein DJ013_20115 [Arcticibacterium luteifluviistationis]
MLPFIGFGQKKENGKIYIEHPAINVVDAFTKAMVSGDTVAMAKHMTDDFISYNPVTSTQFDKGTTKSQFLRNAMVWHDQLDYYSIKAMEGSYPDAFEYAKDPSDNNAVTVESWDILKGVHKTTGVKADMLMHRAFTITKGNKIRRAMLYVNPEVGNEIGRGFSERTNGTIYSQHANINSLRLMLAAAENGAFEKYYSFFSDDATFNDINADIFKAISLEDDQAQKKAFLENFDIVAFEPIGYPDYMHYEMGNSGVLYSWWNLHLTRKSDKKEIELPIHYQHNVNKDGKFNNVISYYNAALLK